MIYIICTCSCWVTFKEAVGSESKADGQFKACNQITSLGCTPTHHPNTDIDAYKCCVYLLVVLVIQYIFWQMSFYPTTLKHKRHTANGWMEMSFYCGIYTHILLLSLWLQ